MAQLPLAQLPLALRGSLCLANVSRKPIEDILNEFSGDELDDWPADDVKDDLGTANTIGRERSPFTHHHISNQKSLSSRARHEAVTLVNMPK